MFKIEWKGDKCKNYYKGRNGRRPLGTGNHITAGTKGSVYHWFISPNSSASSNFLVNRDGSIHQFVRIEDGAWTQGISGDAFDRSKAPIVHDNKRVNPNLYLIGIEHEGYVEGHTENGETVVVNYGLDGDLTEQQFYASCWLHKFCQVETLRIYGKTYPLNPYTATGHFQIDPVRKPFCPGPKFPWARLYKELAIMDTMTLSEYEEHLTFQQSGNAALSNVFTLYVRAKGLKEALKGKYAVEGARKSMLLKDAVLGAGGYSGEVTAEGLLERIIKLYIQWTEKKPYHEEAYRKLILILNRAVESKII